MVTKVCVDCGVDKPVDQFYALKSADDGLTTRCKPCYRAARGTGTPRVTKKTDPHGNTLMTDGGYVASRELLQIWEAVVKTGSGGDHPLTLMFLGPSGCGKTVGAEYLAELAGMSFTKVDAAAMTDPEAWFGTREVVARDGVSVTTYRPSAFVQAIAKPGVVLIDEVNRVRDEHRNILLPLLDGTHAVTNPLTGETVRKDPGCFIVMSGNRGLQFTGTYAVDPALMTRSLVVEFAYLSAADETRVAISRTGVDARIAAAFVRFAGETRSRATLSPDMVPVSTREVLAASELAAKGLDPDLAAQIAIINGASEEGGPDSVRSALAAIWGGIRPTVQAANLG